MQLFFYIRAKSMPVEPANLMSIVERYHQPVRHIYRVIRHESAGATSDLVLHMAAKAAYNFISRDGSSPTFALYGINTGQDLLRSR